MQRSSCSKIYGRVSHITQQLTVTESTKKHCKLPSPNEAGYISTSTPPNQYVVWFTKSARADGDTVVAMIIDVEAIYIKLAR